MENKTLENKVHEEIIILKEENSRLKKALSESDSNLRLIKRSLKANRVLIFNLDPRTLEPLWFNNTQYFNEILGFPRTEQFLFKYKDFISHIHPDDIEIIKIMFDNIFKNKDKIYSFIFRIRNYTGDYIWLYSKIILIDSNDGIEDERIAGLALNINDNLCTLGQLEILNKELMLRKTQMLVNRLTLQEINIGKLIIEGVTNSEIAKKLHISISTVNARKKSIFLKTSTTNSASLTKYFCTHGLY